MASVQVQPLSAVYLRHENSQSLRTEDINFGHRLSMNYIPVQPLDSNIWIGYSIGDTHFIDYLQLPGNAEMKLRGLRTWWESRICAWIHLIYHFIFCLRPAVFIGSLPRIATEAITCQSFPHETQFTTLWKSEFLTRGFRNPSTLVDDAAYFDQRPSFYASPVVGRVIESRNVLFVEWELDKRYLAYPFLGALSVSTFVAVLIGIQQRNLATGAQVGGSLCGVFAAVLCYVIWSCD